MRVVLYLNYLNHHQVAVADAFYDVLGEDFKCVCTQKPSPYELKGGEDYSARAYCINATTSTEHYNQALIFAQIADVCMFGADSLEYAIERAKYNKCGFSFEIGERWLKKGIINIFSPRLIKNMWYYHTLFRHRNFYKLCASAYAAKDQNMLLSYKNKCYKWGYFPKLIECKSKSSISSPVSFMWCSRFLRWKHPELPIKAASILKHKGYDFVLDMYGEGDELECCKDLSQKLNVQDRVNFCGNVPNHEIIEAMKKHDVFLFTSDRNEGWGVVLNEAMASGCAVVCSDLVGSAPYLICDRENGMIFKSCEIKSLVEKIEYLLDNQSVIIELGSKARQTIINFWSPQVAVHNFLKLVLELTSGNNSSLVEGPCSKA